MIVNITSINSLMESFHDNFNGILFWMHNRKETKDAGVICFMEKNIELLWNDSIKKLMEVMLTIRLLS